MLDATGVPLFSASGSPGQDVPHREGAEDIHHLRGHLLPSRISSPLMTHGYGSREVTPPEEQSCKLSERFID
jgi:hypothetical protein